VRRGEAQVEKTGQKTAVKNPKERLGTADARFLEPLLAEGDTTVSARSDFRKPCRDATRGNPRSGQGQEGKALVVMQIRWLLAGGDQDGGQGRAGLKAPSLRTQRGSRVRIDVLKG